MFLYTDNQGGQLLYLSKRLCEMADNKNAWHAPGWITVQHQFPRGPALRVAGWTVRGVAQPQEKGSLKLLRSTRLPSKNTG